MVSDFRPHESYQFFLQEAPDLLRDLEDGVLGLRQGQSVSKLWELMRIAHSIKGGAACAGLEHVQEIAHHLETAFKTIAEGGIEIDLATEDLLLQSFDCLKFPIFEEIQTGGCQAHQAVKKAQQVWGQLDAKLRSQRPEQPRSTEDQDITYLLFSEDVAKGLNRLSTVLAQERNADRLDAIKAQVQIFRGIGEISHLPGFVAIADAVLKAVRRNPQQVDRVGELALRDFQSARAAVLGGDRQQGGCPSPELVTLAQTVSAANLGSAPESNDNHWWEPLDEDAEALASEPAEALTLERTPSSASPVVMSVRQDWDRLELLNALVGELISLDNRFLAQNQQHDATLEVFSRCFSRIKQQTLNLYRWSNQSAVAAEAGAQPSQGIAPALKSSSFLQTTLEDILEELAQLNETFKDLSFLGQQYQQVLKQKQKTTKKVQTNLLQTQMLPVSELLQQFPRMVRDLANRENKQIHLDLQGGSTLIEKPILEKLYDPLVHLVRNAFDHGCELAAVRQALNKPPLATIRIRAWNRGHHIYVTVEDDGQGIDGEVVRAKAIALGWVSPAEAERLSEQQIYQYLFEPNFSTAAAVGHVSGRGMGLYAVQTQISGLKGTVTVNSQLGKGTTFTLRLPLTSTVTKLLVFRVNRHLFALPVNTLASIAIATQDLLQNHQNQTFYYWKGHFVPILTLPSLAAYGYPLPSLGQDELRKSDAASAVAQTAASEPPAASQFPLLLISRGTQAIALKIDEILVEQDLVIKPFNHATLTPPAYLRGCTLLGDGRLVPVLEGSALVEKWGHRSAHTQPSVRVGASALQNSPVPSLLSVLVVDDSLTIRNALTITLRRHGYRVIQAKDGLEAMGLLEQESAIAAIICDIEMPRMSGLEFLSRHRVQHQAVPVIILTYRSGQRYRRLAEQLGASAYLTKPYLDRELLSTLQRCIAPTTGA
ncbi:response regulator [Altericista sp. CCNU0014]|uniref:hybrid sensor histidine kinase/response regulator n=1 Tax=Altericista sp. CCNU0014 TaxID=3082949 RepID=UPI00384FDE21